MHEFGKSGFLPHQCLCHQLAFKRVFCDFFFFSWSCESRTGVLDTYIRTAAVAVIAVKIFV